ncbi:hypothetical protein CQ14_09670 [Bradyrhizobium lablabi]|uniref:Uncharacterized protein n=1 Tax=Bradyrhizobium lablabi TaxID=722472 RepID=A0A0R3N5S0_9BRAD|nr:hypothetical protein [Bradyrhizobium lablabi]KRR25269.1 hypothetical protein CQ14_09670 [Bradyrhizobium lablabi]
MTWIEELIEIVGKRKIALFRVPDDTWNAIESSTRGFASFSMALPHEQLEEVTKRSLCLFVRETGGAPLHLALVRSVSAVTTLQTRLKIEAGAHINPSDIDKLIAMLDTRSSNQLRSAIEHKSPASVLSKKVSQAIMTALSGDSSNEQSLKHIHLLLAVSRFNSAVGLQADAIDTALKIFGYDSSVKAKSLHVVEGADSTIRLLEDSVVAHDARRVPDMSLVGSDVTGYAEFVGNGDRLRVYTANKLPLEKLFGVDLIYLNQRLKNLVLIQYKMLEPNGSESDWLYRPDAQLDVEIERMERFQQTVTGPASYRLNPEAFYMKFVKRKSGVGSGSITIALSHFKELARSSNDPEKRVRVSFNALNGHYLREAGLIDLIKGGYIGCHSELSEGFTELINAVVRGGNAVVAAIEEKISHSSADDTK